MAHDPIDWARLHAIRENFLRPTGQDYWKSAEDLSLYAKTFGRRLEAAWEATLSALARVNCFPSGSYRVLDWGCGPGTAGAALRNVFPGASFEFLVWDRSSLARKYAKDRLRGQVWDQRWEGIDILLFGHSLGELPPAALQEVLKQSANVQGYLFCLEPGTPEGFQTLLELRRNKVPAWTPLAPCPSAKSCPFESADTPPVIATPEGGKQSPRKRGWCHHFVNYPSEMHASPFWSRFFEEMGLDKRSLPISYLFLSNTTKFDPQPLRFLGRPRAGKGHVEVLACTGDSITKKVFTRKDGEIYRWLRKARLLEE